MQAVFYRVRREHIHKDELSKKRLNLLIFQVTFKKFIREATMNLLLVFNSHAANKRAHKLLDPILARFAEKKIRVDLRQTEGPGHAVETVQNADFGRYDGIAAAGGDGTLFEVVNGYFRNQSVKRIPIGVLPVGTGNAFARDLDLDTARWAEAVDVIAAGKTKKTDAGRFQTGNSTWHFMNIIGLGFVADVCKTAHALKWMGNVSYSIGVFHRLIMLKTFRLKIEVDGKTLERENVFTEISNTRWTSNFFMAPSAKIDDGLLDVTLLGKASRRRLLQCFPKIFTGEHVHMPEVEQFQARKIVVEADSAKVLTPDGELLGSTPVTVECLKQAVEVFWR
jgi:diacylglycerol kinase (ATP)